MSDDSNSCGGGLTTRSLRTRKEKKTYSEDWAYGDEEEIEGVRSFSLQEKLDSTRYLNHNFSKQMDGKDFTISYLQKHGFIIPLLFKDKNGLGLHVPSPNFSVNDVRTCVGSRRMLDVMDVNTQKNFEMTMKEWTKYYEEPVKDKLLNVISLEFSHTKLENYIKRPNIVRELDWVDCVWPKHLKESQTESTNVIDDMMYPKVQKYCLMSVKGCYTDFHIDFGGTSVWYHILKGSKVFWLIPPTEQNIKLYEQWILSGKQGDIFFGDTVEQCGRVSLNAGDTFFIPTGWIHAVYTPKDSLVFGGNFLHSFGIEKQLRVAEVEESTKVPQKFRYPFFTEMLWYVLERYVYCDLGKSHLSEGVESLPSPSDEHIHFTKQELHGIKAIVKYLHILPPNKKNVPPLIKDAIELIRHVAIVINKHKNDIPEYAISGKPILKILGDKERERRFYKTAGDMNAKVKTLRKTASGGTGGPRRRRTRCKKCEACKQADCGECSFCRDMVKFGGPGRAKQTCVMRQCLQPMLPITAACGICSLDGWGQQIIIPIQKAAKDTPSQLMECSVCFEIVHPDCLLKQPIYTNNGTFNEDLPNSWECPKCCKEGKESKPRHFRARQKSSDIRRTSVSSNDTTPQKRCKDEEEYSDTNSESDVDNVSNKRLKIEKKENLSTERSPPLPSTEPQSSSCKNERQQVPATAAPVEPSADKSDFENKTPHKKFRRNLTEERKPAKSEPGTSTGNQSPMVATAAVAPPSPEVKSSDGDGSQQTTTERPAEPAEMNVMEAFDRSTVKRSSSPAVAVIKMEAAERPFESANTVADSGVIVKREKLSPIRISEYIPETKAAPEQPTPGGPVSGSVKIEEEIRTNEPIANNVDVPIDEILSNSKKSNHMPKYVIRPVPKLDTEETDKDPRRRCSTLVHVFKFLSAEDLKRCSLVCKDWYTATISPALWNRMDLTETVITPKLIKYVMVRQPKVLILDWCKITKEQLSWLLVRLPQSKALSLQGCPWSTVSCLRSCVCPMLTSLNLSFVPTMDDAALQHILSPPLDHRPGLLDLACRLSNLKSLKLAGSNVTDVGVQVIVRVLPKLSMLDLSQCYPITDSGVESLTQISGLSTLQLSGCTGISEQSLKMLGNCKSLTYLDLRHTKLTKSSINKFVSNREGFKAFDSKLIVKVDKS